MRLEDIPAAIVNGYSISIETCHPDASGKFNDVTEEQHSSLLHAATPFKPLFAVNKSELVNKRSTFMIRQPAIKQV